jgi:hypothetical protein
MGIVTKTEVKNNTEVKRNEKSGFYRMARNGGLSAYAAHD